MIFLIDQWKKSGLSQKKFSKIHGADYCQLNYWIRIKAKTESLGSFIPLHPSTEDKSLNKIEVVFPNGVIVRSLLSTFIRSQHFFKEISRIGRMKKPTRCTFKN